jgi:hypothetical protein
MRGERTRLERDRDQLRHKKRPESPLRQLNAIYQIRLA